MNIYVAGKTQAIAEVRQVQALARHTGHVITHDWTEVVRAWGGDSNEVPIPLEKRREYALNDMGGIHKSGLVIAIGHPNLCGTLWECGMATAWNLPLWLLFWERCARQSIFNDLPHVTMIKDFQDLGERLWEFSEKRLEQRLEINTNFPDQDFYKAVGGTE